MSRSSQADVEIQTACPASPFVRSPDERHHLPYGSIASVKWAKEQIDTGQFDTTLSMTTAVPARVMQPRGGTVRETLERNIAMRSTPAARLNKRLAVFFNPKQRLLQSLEKNAFENLQLFKVAAVSQYVTRQLESHYKLPSDRVELIPNAAVMPEVDADTRLAWRQRIRESFKIPTLRRCFSLPLSIPGSKASIHSCGRWRSSRIVVSMHGFCWLASSGISTIERRETSRQGPRLLHPPHTQDRGPLRPPPTSPSTRRFTTRPARLSSNP